MNKKYTLDFLTCLCNEKSITLLQKYSENELNSQTFIDFKCIDCNENTKKQFNSMIKFDAICRSCSNSKKGAKAKNTMLTKYGVENISQLEEIKNKKKETTLKNYGVEHNSQSKEIKNKKISTCLKNNGVEHPQQSKEIKKKSKHTCLINYGVYYPQQCEELKQKAINTSLEKYGTSYASQSDIFKSKVKSTCLKKYGVEYLQQSKEIRNKSRQTCLTNYGVEYPSQCEEIKQKTITTTLEKYGVEHYSQTEEFKEKCKQTSLEKYGVEHPSQNQEIADKSSKKCYRSKIFAFSSGKEIKCQGYEPFALQYLIENNVEENDIVTGCKNVPTIWYNDETGKKHRHYVDIFRPSQNKCIEVKSTWTFNKKKHIVFLKQNAAKKLGYQYEIWVYDKKGTRVETHI